MFRRALANYRGMNPQFIFVDGLVIAERHIVSVDLRTPYVATVQLTRGNLHTFEGESAMVIARAFADVVLANIPADPDPAPESDLSGEKVPVV